MKKQEFTEAPVIKVLKEYLGNPTTDEVCRELVTHKASLLQL